jgi:uncharacterized protein (DUF427 family)
VLDGRLVEVFDVDSDIARSSQTYRVLETASPPCFYIPPEDIDWDLLTAVSKSSVCEWKGAASYWSLSSNPAIGIVGWSYPNPSAAFQAIRNYVSFYPAILACYVAGERVRPQPGRFYGGWITSDIVGPFKGELGTEWW